MITVSLEIFIFCRQSRADLTFRSCSRDRLLLRSMQPLLYRDSALCERAAFFFSSFFCACAEFVFSTLRRSSLVVCHEARLFVFASICQKIAPNQIPLFDVGRGKRELSNVSTFTTILLQCLVKVSKIPVTLLILTFTVLL